MKTKKFSSPIGQFIKHFDKNIDSPKNHQFGIVYTRKVDKDSENGNSVEQQKTECLNWAESNGITVLKVFEDDGVSGRNKGFAKAMDFVTQLNSNYNSIISYLICSDATIFSRGDSSEILQKVEYLTEYGVKIKFLSEPSIYNLDTTLEQTKKKQEKALFMQEEQPFDVPIGYCRSESNTIELDIALAPLMKDALIMYSDGRFLTEHDIWNYLFKKFWKKNGYPKERGDRVDSYTMAKNILKEPLLRFYCGRIFEPAKGITLPIKGKHKPIIDKDTLEKILLRTTRWEKIRLR